MILPDLVVKSAEQYPDAIAVHAPEASITYRELDVLSNRIARALYELGVRSGDRVALWFDKSVHVVAAMQGVLRVGAAYVPIDPLSPTIRAATIMADCKITALVSNSTRIKEVLTGELAQVASLSVDGQCGSLSWQELDRFSSEPLDLPRRGEHDLAYILYTSGSTGKPKGVCISHLNALAFVEWSAQLLNATHEDRFSNHAPFHFDLSVLDLYAAFLVGAAVHIIPEGISYIPKRLVEFLVDNKITVWYSVPSALILMIEHGELLQLPEIPARAIIFAGEPFPIKHLRRLYDRWPTVRLLNFYGPTETNVCTYYEADTIEPERILPLPIGKASCGDTAWAVKPDGTVANVGEEGELLVTGPTVMLGYWGHPPHGDKPYPTGDIVRLQEDGNYVYIGRRDHMVKVRGHRIELGEIEAALLTHADVQEAAVIVKGSGMDAKLVAFLVSNSANPPGLLAIKEHCSKHLPRYMIVDQVYYTGKPPRTSTGKFDRIKLSELAQEVNNDAGNR